MDRTNQMQEKVFLALRAAVEEHGLEWVELRSAPFEGTVRVQREGRFVTLVKLEYQFHARAFTLLAYRQGRHVAGRSGIDYDDGPTIERLLAQLRTLLPDHDAVTTNNWSSEAEEDVQEREGCTVGACDEQSVRHIRAQSGLMHSKSQARVSLQTKREL